MDNKLKFKIIYPKFEDMVNASKTIVNGLPDLTPMLSEGETKFFHSLAKKWLANFEAYKENLINGMADELSK